MANARGQDPYKKPGASWPLHTHWPATVASFRTWRVSQDCVARDQRPTSQYNIFVAVRRQAESVFSRALTSSSGAKINAKMKRLHAAENRFCSPAGRLR